MPKKSIMAKKTTNDIKKLKAKTEGDSTRFFVQKLNIVPPESFTILIKTMLYKLGTRYKQCI
jgi:hypothetical protein